MNLTRHDTEIALFGLTLGSSIMFASLRAGHPLGEAAQIGASAASGSAAVLYGAGLLTRSLPAAAARVIEFRQLVRMPTLAADVTARDTAMLEQSHDGTEEPPDREHRWRVALRQFLLAGRLAGGLSIRTMTSSGMVTDTGYRALAGALKDNAILEASNAGTSYAPGWDWGRACYWLKHEPLTLPDGEPPRIKF